MAAAKAYRQGYLDASSAYLSSPLSELLPRQYASAVPSSMRDFAMEYPYTTLATIGALGTVSLLSSAYITSRLFRRVAYGTPILSKATRSTGTALPTGMIERRMDDLERRVVSQIQSANRDRKTEVDTFKREILSSLSAHATAGAVIGIEDRVESIASQVEAANRDRRSELHNFRSEVMGQLQVLEDQAKAQVPDKVKESKVMAQIEAANRDRRSELHNFRSEVMGQLLVLEQQGPAQSPISRNVDETASELQILAQIEAANRDRRTELHNFRSEIMGQLQMMEAMTQTLQAANKPITAAKTDHSPSSTGAARKEAIPIASSLSTAVDADTMNKEAFELSRRAILAARKDLLETINDLEELTRPGSTQPTRGFASQSENGAIFEDSIEVADLYLTRIMHDLWLAGTPCHDIWIHDFRYLCRHDDFDSGGSEHECGYKFTDRHESFLQGVNVAMRHFRKVVAELESYVVDTERMEAECAEISPETYRKVADDLVSFNATLEDLLEQMETRTAPRSVEKPEFPGRSMTGADGVEIPVKTEGPDSHGIYRYTYMIDGEEVMDEEDERGCHVGCPGWEVPSERTSQNARDAPDALPKQMTADQQMNPQSYWDTLQHLRSISNKASHGVDASRRWTFHIPAKAKEGDIEAGSRLASLSFGDDSVQSWNGLGSHGSVSSLSSTSGG